MLPKKTLAARRNDCISSSSLCCKRNLSTFYIIREPVECKNGSKRHNQVEIREGGGSKVDIELVEGIALKS